MTAWTAEDIRVASLLEAQLGPIRVIDVIEHKENRMNDTDQAGLDDSFGQDFDGDNGAEGVTYPEVSDNPHNHTYTWSPKLPDNSMLVVRSQTAQGLVEAVEAVVPMAGRLRAAWEGVVGTVAAPPPASPIPPAGQYQAGAGAGVNYNPQMPPPNQPYPGQPAWQQGGAAAPAAPQWSGGQAPQGGGFGAGQQAQRKEFPAPQGWYKLNVPFPGGKDQLHALATQLGIPKGNPNKGGVYNFFGLSPAGQPGKAWYCSPDPNVVVAFAQFTPMPA